jgi:hypothetical protein
MRATGQSLALIGMSLTRRRRTRRRVSDTAIAASAGSFFIEPVPRVRN